MTVSEELLTQLKTRFQAISTKLDIDKMKQELIELEAKSFKSDFWSDINTAQTTMLQISDLKKSIGELEEIAGQLETLTGLNNLPASENADLDLSTEAKAIESRIDKIESKLYLSGKYDQNGCFLSIHAGQGGVEAMDWAAMLTRMYQRFCERKDWKVLLVDETKGEEAGIKAITFEISGHLAYGLLKKESGTHRLVRLSPFNADNLRQTSFALVEVLPKIENSSEVDLKESDLEIDTFRSSGPGGQNVQKVSTAVRVKHVPSGIVVTCQSERSQFQNKENALKILQAKLFQVQEEERKKSEVNLKNWEKTASWGTQIRSYVLHPYKQVKDLRTNVETSDTEAVLDGELEPFIEAEIRL